ncbi:helix-turn-helix transcriptional regulator [Saccharomonospora glauca]|jgi:transcriptional regulator with XRE-family HTH domain|uniref:Putative transcriptional regulator n=1 Tax=Saccharomonospora glauca K62 TaxID=928724 RepID=I1D4N8_9PSEU|nr:helix-turn-helix domain-containing protein [Saccharomonospora glauca]EIE99912.1 putative transcriptional regulator [Saccharomonospora glauca K62]
MSTTPTTFAEKLAFLIETMHPASRGPYDDEELAQAWGVSRQYVWQLRTGRRAEPRHSVAMKIVRFFGVPEDYFVDDDVTVAVMRQIQDLIDRRDGTPDADDPGENVELRRLALRILGLSTDERELVSNMVDKLRAYESTPRHRRSRRKPSPVDQG